MLIMLNIRYLQLVVPLSIGRIFQNEQFSILNLNGSNTFFLLTDTFNFFYCRGDSMLTLNFKRILVRFVLNDMALIPCQNLPVMFPYKRIQQWWGYLFPRIYFKKDGQLLFSVIIIPWGKVSGYCYYKGVSQKGDHNGRSWNSVLIIGKVQGVRV